MLLALLVVVVEPEETITVGPEVTRRWALGEEGGGGRRITDTTLCVCSHIRRKRRMLPKIVIMVLLPNVFEGLTLLYIISRPTQRIMILT